MNELLRHFIENKKDSVIVKDIIVYGYQFKYDYKLLGSVTDFLFEDLCINEDYMIVKGALNRPGEIYQKYYVTVHDTASSASTGNGLAHAKYVYNGGGGTSWHYTCSHDGIYHHIPDNENAYHAGDGRRDYILTPSGIKCSNKNPSVSISSDGYYELDGIKSCVIAPTNEEGLILSTKDINDQGIRVVVIDGEYFIGNTYYNTGYHFIANGGGNRNSIGIESCINQGSDIYYTWQKLSKLVAKLVLENNLDISDVKPHHFFSGKPCPMTMRRAGMWDTFMKHVEFEYMIMTKYQDYKIEFVSHNTEYLNNLGKVIKQPTHDLVVSYDIIVTYKGNLEKITLSSLIPGLN